ncbi:MAG: AAA family ATPase [Candidatus Woesearchaeota archaeon]
MMDKKIVVGITGTIASGKDLIAGFFKEKGFQIISLGEIIREELSKKGIPLTRQNQQDLGNQLRKEFGGHVLAERALKKFQSYSAPLVIIGIRNLDEIKYLKENSKFYLIGIDAPLEIRWERVKKRNRDSDLLNHDRFVIDDARDRGFGEPLNGQQVGMCLVQADFLINNDEEIKGPIENSKIYKDFSEVYKKIIKH